MGQVRVADDGVLGDCQRLGVRVGDCFPPAIGLVRLLLT